MYMTLIDIGGTASEDLELLHTFGRNYILANNVAVILAMRE